MKPTLTISLDIYNTNIYVFFDRKKYDKWEKEILKKEVSKIPSHWASFFVRLFKKQDDGFHTLYRVIVIDPEELFLAAAHESLHATFDLFDDIKVQFEYQNSEVFAYLLGYITEKIITYGLLHVIKPVKNEKV